jgi:aryl-alcohol dehydrogenase-like predicted oxidoreductase
MRTGRLGRTELQVPSMGLGTWSIFDNHEDRRPLVEEALAAGVNLFDSSPMYGIAEERLAAALGTRRSQALIATKISARDAATGLAQLRRALELFGTVDLFQIHNIVGWKLHLPVLEKLKAEGGCRAIGASQGLLVCDEALIEVMRTGVLDCIQVRYNPNRLQALDKILPLAQELGMGVMVMQPLRWGVLLAEPSERELQELGVETWAQAILRWILSDPGVTTVLTASATSGRIMANARVADLPAFDSSQRLQVERILSRGIRSSTTRVREIAPAALLRTLGNFLLDRKGASYCDSCLGRELQVSAAVAFEARHQLGSEFVNETGPCLVCGSHAGVVRSKTIIR